MYLQELLSPDQKTDRVTYIGQILSITESWIGTKHGEEGHLCARFRILSPAIRLWRQCKLTNSTQQIVLRMFIE